MTEDLFGAQLDGADLAVDLKAAPLPSVDQARALWDRYQMLDNIRDHSEVVCRVALAITDWLAAAGVALRREAVEVGSLLHDIAKTQCLNSDRRHDKEGQEILVELGYPELGFLVYRHVVLPVGYPLDETMVVNYADKRVKHNRIVDLDERYRYILERYGRGDRERIDRINLGLARALEVEQTVFDPIMPARTPQDIAALEPA